MVALYLPKKYQFITNVYQAAILCLFNQDNEVTCADIKKRTAISDEQFKPAMMKFCDPKIKVLLKQVNKPVFGEDEKIKPNPKF